MPDPSTPLFSYRKHWAECLGPAPWLPMCRTEMEQLGWDSCDIIIVSGDGYVDHPSFGMAVIGRVLEAQGFRVGMIAQPDWQSAEPFTALGRPNLFFGVTAGNMDSMINHYTADRKRRNDDAYTPGNIAGKRPDRAVTVYSQRLKEAYRDVPIIIGGIEASLRRIAHYDYWGDRVKRSVLLDSRADLLVFGNAERAIVDIAHRLANGEPAREITDIRGTAFVTRHPPADRTLINSTSVDAPGRIEAHPNPYEGMEPEPCAEGQSDKSGETDPTPVRLMASSKQDTHAIRLPSAEAVAEDPVLYAHASRVFHKETNPHNALPLIQAHGDREVWLNPPPIPLETDELDWVFELPYQRLPHPSYGDAEVPAMEMIQHSVNIMRGCFGGCTFCSITEHEGRIIQSRSEASVLREVERIRDTSPAFTGVISDLGGPTAICGALPAKTKKLKRPAENSAACTPASAKT